MSSSPDSEHFIKEQIKISYGEKSETDEMVVLRTVFLHLCVS